MNSRTITRVVLWTFSLFNFNVMYSFLVLANEENLELYYVSLEAENQACNLAVNRRSHASSHQTVYLKPGDTLRLDLCVAHDTLVHIMGVFYSCDTRETTVELLMDGLPLGNFSTPAYSNNSKMWKEFLDSGPIGNFQMLEPGSHCVDLHVSLNQTQGIEIDQLYIGTNDKYINREILTCKLSCMCELDRAEVHKPKTDVMPATFIQRSIPSKCAEEENIDIALVHPTLQSYRITASHPGYNSMLNYQDRNFRNCGDINSMLLWMIKNEPNDKHNVLTNIKSMEITLNALEPYAVKIVFPLQGKSKGSIDADIGSLLMIKFREITHNFSIDMTFKGRHKNISPGQIKGFNRTNINAFWTIPDYSWSDNGFNEISLVFMTNQSQRIVIDYLALKRRQQRGETLTTLYEDVDTTVVGVNIDFWWRRPYTMNVTLENGLGNETIFENIDYIRLQKRNVGCCQKSEMFILYQDGKSRSLPPLIHGIDVIPFGSSVIIGPTNVTCSKPAADIRSLHIYQVVPTFKFQIIYYDNSNATVEVSTSGLETHVCVSDINMTKNRTETPFAHFRSTWITNGNSNVDHFKTSGENGQPILKDWTYLESTWAKFYRSCESKYLSKSPDMSIELLQ